MITWLTYFPMVYSDYFYVRWRKRVIVCKNIKKPKRKARRIIHAITTITTMSNDPWDVDSAFSRRIGVRLVICH